MKPSESSCRVLIVDDFVDAADLLAKLFRLHGHEADVSFSGEHALAVAASELPDLVLCEVGLAGEDGFTLGARLREALPAHTVLVALTRRVEPDDMRLSLAAGFDMHLPKPASFEQLQRLLPSDNFEVACCR